MNFVLKLTTFLSSIVDSLGTSKDFLEGKARTILEEFPDDQKAAGEKWLTWFISEYEGKIGDFESAKHFGQQLWESATGDKPAYNRHHFFNL